MLLEILSEYVYNNSRENQLLRRFLQEDIERLLFLMNSFKEIYRYERKLKAYVFSPEIYNEMSVYVREESRKDGLELNEEEFEEIVRIKNEIDIDSAEPCLNDGFDLRILNEEESLSLTLKLRKWSEWDDNIEDGIFKFYDCYGVFPNYLFANEHTFSQINFMVNIMPEARQMVFGYDDETGDKIEINREEEIRIGSYVSDVYNVEFRLNEDLKDKMYELMYISERDDDEDDDDDSEDDFVPVDDPVGVEKIII